MKNLNIDPFAVYRLIPIGQLQVTRENLRVYSDELDRLETQLQKCPNIGETESMEEHPAIFHYFYGSTDIYICEYDHKDLMFGYAILGGDLPNSEWGYFKLSEITKIRQFNIDYHFEEQSIEAALHKEYPDYFRKPQSIIDYMRIGKNDPLPDTYRDFPYQYTRTKVGTVLRNNENEVFLQGDEETQFFRDCNRAKQKGHNISYLISEYFTN
jgi:hypothetical protein